MGFKPGNTEGLKANHHQPKLFRDALLASLKRASAQGVEAIDGKVPQGHGGAEDLPAIHTRTEVVYTIVDPANSDSGSPGIPTIIKTGEV